MTEDEMVGWHHRLDGHEFEQALGVGDTYIQKEIQYRELAYAVTEVAKSKP